MLPGTRLLTKRVLPGARRREHRSLALLCSFTALTHLAAQLSLAPRGRLLTKPVDEAQRSLAPSCRLPLALEEPTCLLQPHAQVRVLQIGLRLRVLQRLDRKRHPRGRRRCARYSASCCRRSARSALITALVLGRLRTCRRRLARRGGGRFVCVVMDDTRARVH